SQMFDCRRRNATRRTGLSGVCALWWLPGSMLFGADRVDYMRSIKRIFTARCYACHAALRQQSGQRLDTVDCVKQGGDTGPPIDAFIAAEHEKRGLTAQGLADKSTLLRRVYLDLIGLPPTREELQAFLKDDSADAYEKVVDRLLASKQYGERWGRHWMDVWRY